MTQIFTIRLFWVLAIIASIPAFVNISVKPKQVFDGNKLKFLARSGLALNPTSTQICIQNYANLTTTR